MRVLNNPAVADLLPRDDNNSFLLSLSNQWKRSKKAPGPVTTIVCAYEKLPLSGIGLVVPETSASGLCDDDADAIPEDHIGIVKPDGAEHQSVKVLANALTALMSLAAEITGTITDATTGHPVTAAVVVVAGRTLTVGSEGQFRVPGHVPNSDVVISVMAPGYRPANVTVSPPLRDPVIVQLTRERDQ
jgi:hypothetical protein